MNAKTIGAVIVGVIVLAVGWYFYDMQRQAAKWKNAKEIVEESFNKDGAVATIRYVGVINGPIVLATGSGSRFQTRVASAKRRLDGLRSGRLWRRSRMY